MKKQKGFSIIEVSIAITIIAVGFIGIASLAIQNIQVQYVSKNTLVASQLTQEGLEMVRNVRDSNWNDGKNWKEGLVNPVFDYDYQGNIVVLNDINDPNAVLKIDSTNKMYNHSSGENSPFSRIIEMSDMGDYLDVLCRVQWQDKTGKNQYTAKTYLYDWR